ncbi:hypothetical protein DOTSEDRAFT_63516 [Dothistroma septosporum NZE10]|uniref:Uncharacterized protein n=1 Tax=Dothistroma septosporum (strain NZE10 / CBS 128990) TaxID=675120 RepID=M2Y4P5_DOTSN|nr:hypothetical protein DOTSEDRAFT_63516 [Dothistroma septosporum NZE10]
MYDISLSIYAIVALVTVAIGWRTYAALTNPLAHLPGPMISKWTHHRFQIAIMTGERARYEHALHERYVSLAYSSSGKTIYQIGSPFLKTPWYPTATGNPSGLFTLLDRKAHAQRRRLMAHNYSEAWVKNMAPYIAEKTQIAVQKMIEQVDRNGYVNVNEWFWFMSTDVISEAKFGDSFDFLKIGQKNQCIHDLESNGPRGVLRAEFPYSGGMLAHLLFGSARDVSKGLKRMKSYIIAGTDTTASTATFAVWYLSQNPEIEQALIREVSALPATFDNEKLRDLKVLDNVIRETLRVRPSVGQGLPRHYIPGGTTVAIPAYSMHRIRSVWSEPGKFDPEKFDPEKFDPSRWEDVTRDMKDSFHFAQLELRHALANFYRTFSSGMVASKAEGFCEDDMTPMSFFVTALKGRRCLLERRSKH